MKKYKIAILDTHPVQYRVPLFRKISEVANIDLIVYYCSNLGMNKKFFDAGFGKQIKWDIPLTESYKYKVLPNKSPFPGMHFFNLINIGIINEIRKGDYDALMIYGYTTATVWLTYFAAWSSRTPVMYQSESHLFTRASLPKKIIKYIIFKFLFPRISAFLAIGSPNKDYYKYYGVPEKKIFLTPYSVDNDYFQEQAKKLIPEKKRLRAKLRLRSDIPVILFVAKMIPRKNPFDLLQAYEKLRINTPAQLVLVGDGQQLKQLKAYVKEKKIADVHFAGFKNQSQLPEYYAMADIFVLPSQEETWGLVINEAMNFKLPVLTTDKVGASFDLVKHGRNGYIYPVNNIEELETCLVALLLKARLRHKMGRMSGTIINKWNYAAGIKGILRALSLMEGKK